MMNVELSANAKAILLLTAPLIVGRGKSSAAPLSLGEYRLFARRLRDVQRQPADLLDPGARDIWKESRTRLDSGRLERLLDRGFLLSQAIECWRTRAIWVVSRADAGYPNRLKKRLRDHAPTVLYGCGDATILDTGGLAVVGSRKVDEALLKYTEDVGRLAATSTCTLVSGGARGVDQAAMRGALEADGRAVGILANGLASIVMRREHRQVLIDRRLVLVSPYDPAARFHVGHAMQRNKLIYALSDTALVVNSDYEKGGTWAGAVEQLGKLKLVPVFVRTSKKPNKGLDGLRERGAEAWPEPRTPEAFTKILDASPDMKHGVSKQRLLSTASRSGSAQLADTQQTVPTGPIISSEHHVAADSTPATELFAKVRELIKRMSGPKTVANVADALEIQKGQASVWLRSFVEAEVAELFRCSSENRTEGSIARALQVPRHQVRVCLKQMVEEGKIELLSRRPAKYRSGGSTGLPFNPQD